MQKIDGLNVSENSDKLDKLLEMMQTNQSMVKAQNALIRKMQSDYNRGIANTKQEVTMALEPFDFTGVLKDSLSRFHKGTREWALKAYDEWVQKKESKMTPAAKSYPQFGSSILRNSALRDFFSSFLRRSFRSASDSDPIAFPLLFFFSLPGATTCAADDADVLRRNDILGK